MTNKPNYRALAKEALSNIRKELASSKDYRLHNAVLWSRIGLEAATYDRAQYYKDQLPKSALKSWQPKKLMSAVLEVDERAFMSATLSIASEESGVNIQNLEYQTLGTDERFGPDDIKKLYNALGNYLHAPSLDQAAKPKQSAARSMREKSLLASQLIERVVSARIWGLNFGSNAKFDCLLCNYEVPIILYMRQNSQIAHCPNCEAKYNFSKDSGKDDWDFKIDKSNLFLCPYSDCQKHTPINYELHQLPIKFDCMHCKRNLVIAPHIGYDPEQKRPADD